MVRGGDELPLDGRSDGANVDGMEVVGNVDGSTAVGVVAFTEGARELTVGGVEGNDDKSSPAVVGSFVGLLVGSVNETAFGRFVAFEVGEGEGLAVKVLSLGTDVAFLGTVSSGAVVVFGIGEGGAVLPGRPLLMGC